MEPKTFLDIKRPQYISPSALGKWRENQEQFYLKYLAIERPPRYPQNNAMAVGSAFDAYIKSFLHRTLFGPQHKDSNQFQFDAIFQKQVETPNRDYALHAGAHCFTAYKDSGALQMLLNLLRRSKREPRFEFTKCGQIDPEYGNVYSAVTLGKQAEFHIGEIKNPVVLLGKPDLDFYTEEDFHVNFEWKVNGYCSAWGKGPVKGYHNLLDGWKAEEAPPSRGNNGPHKECHPWREKGFAMNMIPNVEQEQPDWARQLATYGWLTGTPVGDQTFIGVDQLACKPGGSGKLIQIAQHRCEITEAFQINTYKEYQELWDIIQSDHIFRHLSLEDSIARCEVLSKQVHAYMAVEDQDKGAWLQSIMGRG